MGAVIPRLARTVRDIAAEFGVDRVEFTMVGKHILAEFYCPDGTIRHLSISRGNPKDHEHKLRGWIRQAIQNDTFLRKPRA
jgi:hypothetical protein